MSVEQRDSIVDDLLNEYRARTRSKSKISTPNNPNPDNDQSLPVDRFVDPPQTADAVRAMDSNFFSNLTNVSYGAYLVQDLEDHEYLQYPDHNDNEPQHHNDWINTLQLTQQHTEYTHCPPSNEQNDQISIKQSATMDMSPSNPLNGSKVAMQRNLRNLKKKQNKLRAQSVSTRKRPHSANPSHRNRMRRKKRVNSVQSTNSLNRQQRQQSMTEELERKEEENVTFKPKINDYAFNRRIDPDVFRRLEIWEMQRKRKLTHRRKQKVEETKLAMEPSPRKMTGSKSRKMVKSQRCSISSMTDEAVQSKPVQDRLYEQEQRRIDKLAKTKEMIECQEMEQCSFRPKLSVSKFRSKFETKLADREPIWKRQDIISKQNATKKMKQKQESDPELTFKPKISRKSKAIVEAAKTLNPCHPLQLPISERLKTRKKQTEMEHDHKVSINPTSEKILKESILFREASDNFFQRLSIYEMERKMKEAEQQRLKRQSDHKLNKEFHPNIGNADAVLSKSKRHRHRYQYEDKEQRFQRLAFHDSEMMARKTRMKAKELEKENTFKPRINPKSAAMGRPSSVFELFQPEKSTKLKDQIKEEAKRIFDAQHPFKPEIKSENENQHKSGDQLVVVPVTESTNKSTETRRKSRCLSYRRYEGAKKQKLLEARKQLDALKMKECTFRPQTNHKQRRRLKQNFTVNGLDRFKELNKMALQKQLENQHRKQDVFRVNPDVLTSSRRRNAKGSLHTVAQPFKLHTERRRRRSTAQTNEVSPESKNPNQDSSNAKSIVAKRREMAWNILQKGLEDDGTSSLAGNSEILSLDSLLTFDLGSEFLSDSVSDGTFAVSDVSM